MRWIKPRTSFTWAHLRWAYGEMHRVTRADYWSSPALVPGSRFYRECRALRGHIPLDH